jgi:hypothetical protein
MGFSQQINDMKPILNYTSVNVEGDLKIMKKTPKEGLLLLMSIEKK